MHIYFNPRFREGSDYPFIKIMIPDNDFNPRFREGSDPDVEVTKNILGISIHASAKEAT